MAQTVNDGTYASSDLGTILDEIINTNPQLTQRIVDVKNESNIFLCKVLRYYTYKDMALVRVLNDGSEILCHMTHDVLSRDVSIKSMNSGLVKTDESNGTYVVPHSDIYGIVAKVRWNGVTDENCFISCVNLNNDDDLKSIVKDGEIVLTVNDSKISITKERINILTPNLFVNGLPYDAPELSNYYDTNQIDVIQEITDSRIKQLDDKIGNIDGDNISNLIDDMNNKIEEFESLDFDEYMTWNDYETDLHNSTDNGKFLDGLDNIIDLLEIYGR